jgi:hypothetical protein
VSPGELVHPVRLSGSAGAIPFASRLVIYYTPFSGDISIRQNVRPGTKQKFKLKYGPKAGALRRVIQSFRFGSLE